MEERAELSVIRKPLLGRDETTLDDKGRLTLSQKRRERLGETFVITLSDVGCLAAYPTDVFEARVREVMQGSPSSPGRMEYARLLAENTEDDVKFDSQNRFSVPAHLRRAAKLPDRSKIVVVGAIDHLQLWSREEYEKYEEFRDAYSKERRERFREAYEAMTSATGQAAGAPRA